MPTASEFGEGVAGRYTAEKLKLKAKQALRLKMTMATLVGNFDHSDIILESSDGRQLPAHLCILKNRAPGFYKSYIERFDPGASTNGGDDHECLSPRQRASPVVKICDVDYNSLKFFLRCIYTAEEVPPHPTMCTDAILTTSSMSSSGYDPTRDNDDDNNSNHRFLASSSGQCQQEQRDEQHTTMDQSGTTTMTGSAGSARLATSIDSHSSGRTYVLDEHEAVEQTNSLISSQQSTPARSSRFRTSPDRGTRALTVSAYSTVSDAAVEPSTKRQLMTFSATATTAASIADPAVNGGGETKMITSFAELATATNIVMNGKENDGGVSTTAKSGAMMVESPESLALTTSMESATSEDRYSDATSGDTLTRRHRADNMIAKFIRVDGASTSSEQSPQQHQPPPADKKIFPMFFEMDGSRPSRLSLCESDTVPLAVAAANAFRRSGSGCTIDSPARSSQMGRKRWSVTSLRSIDSADLASPLSSHGSIISGLDEEHTDLGTEDCSLQGACSRLGKDLINMLVDGKDTDLTIVTNGGELRAHRCILATSCAYFKAMLNGDWLENKNGIIELKGYSENTITCALRMIYGGVVDVPENVSVWELISFADMIQLDDLKQVAYLQIRGKYCHFFHKPCSGCVNGVLECLPLLRSLGVEELLGRCRQWQAKYFSRIWKTKMFNSLPEDILDLCYKSVLDSMTANNIFDIMLGCEKLQLTLPKSKSAEAAGALIACLTDAAFEYLSSHFDAVIQSSSFTSLGKGYALNLSLFEDILPGVIHSLSADTGCKSLVGIYELMTLIASQQQTGEEDWNERFINLLRRLYELCDTHLIHHASTVVSCDSWKLLTADMQRRIKETGIFVDLRQPKAPPPRFSSFNRTYKRSSSSADRVRDRSVSVQRFRPPPPLAECPSKTNVAAESPTTQSTKSLVSIPSQAKLTTSERSKDRRSSASATSGTQSKTSVSESPAATCKEPDVTTTLKRSSTTELTTEKTVNANVPIIDPTLPAAVGVVEVKAAEVVPDVEQTANVVVKEVANKKEEISSIGSESSRNQSDHKVGQKAVTGAPSGSAPNSRTIQQSPASNSKSIKVTGDGATLEKPTEQKVVSRSLKQPQQVNVGKGGQTVKKIRSGEGTGNSTHDSTGVSKPAAAGAVLRAVENKAATGQPDQQPAVSSSTVRQPDTDSSRNAEEASEKNTLVATDVPAVSGTATGEADPANAATKTTEKAGLATERGDSESAPAAEIGEKQCLSELQLDLERPSSTDQEDAKPDTERISVSGTEKRQVTKQGPVATVPPVVSSPKKSMPAAVAKPTAKVAGIPKTSPSSQSSATTTTGSTQRHATSRGSRFGGSTSERTTVRTGSSSNTNASRPRSSDMTHSPMRKAKNPLNSRTVTAKK